MTPERIQEMRKAEEEWRWLNLEVADTIREALDEIERLQSKTTRMKDAADAFRALYICYRTGGRPTKKLFTKLEKAKITMQESDHEQ